MYYTSKYGNILVLENGTYRMIKMQSGHPEYEAYVDYLRGEGEVIQTEEIAQYEEAFVFKHLTNEIPLWRLRVVLTMMNLISQIDTILDALPEPQRTAAMGVWNYGTVIERNSQTVLFLQRQLGLSDLEVDEIFYQAYSIQL